MAFRFYLAVDLRELPLFVDDECAALDAHVLFSVHAFFHPHPILREHFFPLIREEWKRDALGFNKFLLFCCHTLFFRTKEFHERITEFFYYLVIQNSYRKYGFLQLC